MIQYPHTDVAEDDPVHIEDDSVFTYWGCRRLFNILILRSMMKMYDVVPKIPMTYRVSLEICTVVIADVEYLSS